MKLLELFAGSRSFGKEADKRGWEVCSSDINPFDNVNIVKSIFDLFPDDIPFIPDIIQASPPCEGFSVGSIGKHWNHDNTPKTEKAQLSIDIVKKTLQLIEYYRNINPDLIYIIENPTGKLRKLDILNNEDLHAITYCSYGDDRMKPSDIWTNLNWNHKTKCIRGNKNCHHEPAPRGSKTGTQGRKSYYDKSKIPNNLVIELFDTIENK